MAEQNPTTVPYPCSQCGKNAPIRYTWGKVGDWNGKVKKGESLCTRCFQQRGGENFFGPNRIATTS